jgi:hypothetical protein
MILSEEAKKVSEIGKLRKVEVCKEANGIADMRSFVVFQQGEVYSCAESGKEGHPFEALPELLNEAYKEGFRKFDTISFVLDSYYKRSMVLDPESQAPEGYEKGDFAKDFKHNPSSDIAECIAVITYHYLGGSAGSVVEYKYDDNGKPVFVEIEGDTSELFKSEVCDYVFNSFIEYCHSRSQDPEL